MDTFRRLQSIAKANKAGAVYSHVHIEGGRAWATDSYRLYSAPTTRAACGPDCGWPVGMIGEVRGAASNLIAMVDVTHTHIKRAVKLGLAIYKDCTKDSDHGYKGTRWLKLDANGALDVSADSEFGSTCTTLEHGAQWNERKIMKRGMFQGYKKSEVTYRKAGDDTSGYYEGEKLLNALMLMQDIKAERVELLMWETSLAFGITVKSGEVEALLMGRALEVS